MGKKKKSGGKWSSAEKTTAGLGLFFMALGLLSILLAVFRIVEVEKSKDYFMSDAVATYVEYKEADLSAAQIRYINEYRDSYGFDPYIEHEHYYKAKVEAEIDGQKIKGVYYSEDSVSKDDTVQVPVLKKANGKYKIIDPLKYNFAYYIVVGVIACVIGLGLVLMTLLSRKMDKKGAKKK